MPGRAMAEGPMHLLKVCSRKLSKLLCNVHKHLAWLWEIEQEAMKMFDSNLRVEPELMPKTPSQKKHRRKKRSSSLKDENNELTRKRLSRRKSSIKPASLKQVSQRLRSKERLEKPSDVGKEASIGCCTTRFCSKAAPSEAVSEKPAILLVEGRVPMAEISVNDCCGADLHLKGNRPEIIDQALVICAQGDDLQVPQKPEVTELQRVSAASVLVIPDTPEAKGTGEDQSAPNFRIANTSTPKAGENGDPAAEDVSVQGPEKELFQDLKDSTGTSTGSKSSCPSVRRSQMSRSHKHRRISLAEKYSLASKRERMIRKSISRAISKKAAAQESSSASSQVSCHSSLEVFMDEDATSNVRLELELNAECDKAPKPVQKSFIIPNEGCPVAEQSAQAEQPNRAEQQAGNSKESHLKKSGTPQSKEQPQNAKPLEQPPSVRRQSYKQAVDELCDGLLLNMISPSYDKTTSPANKTLSSPSPASKVVRPFKHFLQTVQKNQLLVSPGSTGHSSVMKNLIKRNTPTRSDPKEKERQRLESLRKKQEAEQQRKQKVEEEKRRRLEEMKLKREERLRKALQARERVEQMEEEKKKRMEQKLSQTEEKSEKVRQEKVVEEKTKKKIAKKTEDVEARKQRVLQKEEDEHKQQELLQKRIEDEQRDKGRKIAELKRLPVPPVAALPRERDLKQQEKGKSLHLQMELAVVTEEEENQKKEEQNPEGQEQQQPQENKTKPPESVAIIPCKLLNITVKKYPISDSYPGPPSGPKEPRSTKVNPNNYGLDLNSDDSTDDESQPRKPIPVWATGTQLNQAVIYQYYNPPNINSLFGVIVSPKLEDIFYKNKPRYFKRTSSAVWHSPPLPSAKSMLGLPSNLKKY
ncbi:inner centromere protein-like isoform X2 [Emydura macquarii macquarii]|uniref:inner centromere protein-like isoform X2 n=1 Tax=Emydura macquarii macquarii TaxID=1129001 RepID=UPI003529DED3